MWFTRLTKGMSLGENGCGRSSVPLLSRHTTLSPRDNIMNSTLDSLPEGMMGDKQCSGVLGKALGFHAFIQCAEVHIKAYNFYQAAQDDAA